ncbi:hypothetical protein Pmani_031803 [Petrolisthes manimaculis]|uniref:Gamma-glutamylcyclotransferase family protein n=1 Tax=Petrolisthes manimaculis TaxID=1843537 RepID=A0AAE1NUD0_9EUCA|nr:hypothetical protein Pmani_031803 [Petrolisthes manimaculis]
MLSFVYSSCSLVLLRYSGTTITLNSRRVLSNMSQHMVFVYGTLKEDEPNHHWLTDKENGEARFVGIGTTRERYPLVIASRYNIPYLLAAPGKGEHVEGEVYKIDDKMLSKLDILEDHPKYYERKIKKVRLESEEEVECWVYLLFEFKPYMLELPFLTTYLSKGDLSKPYVASEDDISDPDDI